MGVIRPVAVAIAVSIPLLLTGCFEQPEVEIHEPGQYKGQADPLLKVAGTPEQDEKLAERIKMIQTDR